MGNATPDLTDTEIDLICDGLVQPAAMIRHLQRMGLTVRRKPNGKPLVNRRHYDAVTGGAMAPAQIASCEPNWGVAA